jgi:hypothetical protein
VVDVGQLDAGVLDDVLNGALVRSSRSLVICSNCARVIVSSRWIGPFSDIERYCSEMWSCSSRGQLLLGLLGGVAQTLHGDLVLGQVDAGAVLDRGEQVADDALVPVVATEAVVTEVALTWIVAKPSSGSLPTSRRETSKVPPPRSKTRMSSSSLPLSRP